MDTAQTILVIMLSAFLALFLLLGILLIVKITKLVKAMEEITVRAREVVDNVETASEVFKKTAGPLALGRFFVNMADTVMKHKRGK